MSDPDISPSLQGADKSSYDASSFAKGFFLAAEWIKFIAWRVALLFGLVLSVLLVIPPLVAGLGRLIHRHNQRQAHAWRTQRANSIVGQLDDGQRPAYCLYLRPFLTSDALQIANSRFHRKYFPSMDRFFGRRIDLETVLAMALERKTYPLIAIGDTGFQVGAAKITTSDENWQEMFAKLANDAAAVVIVPLPRPSTLWELDHLIQSESLLRKTLFIMPMRMRSGVQERLEPLWHDMHVQLQQRGIIFPAFTARGAIFCMSDAGANCHQIDSGEFDQDFLERVIAGTIHRKEIDTIFSGLAEQDQRDCLELFSLFLYVVPGTSRLASRALPVQQIQSRNSRFLAVMLDHGFIVTYRSPEGPEGRMEANVHPMLLNWAPLVAAANNIADRLAAKGALVESRKEWRRWFSSVLETMNDSPLAPCTGGPTEYRPAAALEDAQTLPTFFDELSPEERAFARRASLEH
jgi:hypothetical protein